MQWTWQATRGDGFVWRCPVCHKTKSIRNGSFFSQSKLPLHTWVHVLHQWAMEVPVTKACKQTLISEKRCIDVYQWCRDVCSTKLLANPIVLGGPGTVVQIDESLFTPGPKVNVQHYMAIMCNICKQVNHIILWYGRGQTAVHEQWVFGMVDTSVTPSLGYMELVDDRSNSTLLPIIQAHIAPGTEIWSDQWAAYNTVNSLTNVSNHQTVNHSIEFKNPS